MGKLSPKQQFFVAEYLIDLNATKAAERAGYSKKTAKEQASRLLTNVHVSAQIAEMQADRLKRLEITAGSVLQELARIGFANMLDYVEITPDGSARVDLSRLTREQAAAIVEITVEEFTERAGAGSPILGKRTRFKLADKRAALVDLGRHLKLFTDKIQVEGEMQFEVRNVKQKLLAKLSGRPGSTLGD